MPVTKRRRGKCGRPTYPTRAEAQRAAGRGNRQCENPEIQCLPYECPDGEHHVMLWPRYERATSCTCGQPKLPTLRGADVLLAYLQSKHPDDQNPYVMFRCEDAGIHIARDRAVPASAERAAHTQETR